jgi:RNA polymerase sigma factor (sigma-70 family)
MADMGHIAMTDAELIERSRRGERDAFGQLVTRYQDIVCAVSYSSTGNWALSEDVAQETFIAAWRQLGQLREVARLRAWLCGIARNLARKASARRRGLHEEVSDDLPASDDSPFDTTAQAEVDRVVRDALARVPDTYRETLVLYYCENQSVREVADALGIAEANAMQRLTRGRRYLAYGVHKLVERSLGSARCAKNLAPLVIAALPLAIPSRVDASTPGKGSTMLKVAVVASVLAAAGTTAAIVHHSSSQPTPVAAAPATVAAASQAPAPAPSPTPAAVPTAPATPHLAPDPKSAVPRETAEPPELSVDSATIKRLALDRGPSRGSAEAPVTIVLFQDLMCPYCGRILGTLDELMDEYPGKVRIVLKQFPIHPPAKLAAEASLAAEAQGKFWELHDLMMANQDDLSRDALLDYGRQAGLDVKQLADALDHHTYADALAKEVEAGKEIGVRATPQMLINGQGIRGAVPIEVYRAAIDDALANR